VYNLPNLLTISRIAVIPLIFLSAYFKSCTVNYIAGVLFIAASITDYYDGKLARARGEVSAFGRLLDPIADKLLVATALVVFLTKQVSINGTFDPIIHKISFIPVFVILCRELLVSGLREFLREVNVGLPVTRLAKWKTGFQMTALSMIFFKGWWIWGTVGEILLWVAGILTFITGYQYFERSLAYIKGENQKLSIQKATQSTPKAAPKAASKKANANKKK
jgi:cardiolipin synthase